MMMPLSVSLPAIVLFCFWLPFLHAYFVLTRYSSHPSAAAQNPEDSSIGIWNPPAEQQQSPLDLANELEVEDWVRLPFHQWIGSTNLQNGEEAKAKRSAGAAKTLPGHEHVCQTIIRTDFRPKHGHEQNGTRVEIQQDDRRQFSATFVECESSKREHCHGIDNTMFSSECVNLYEFRPAGVRVEGSGDDFMEGLVKVPITCQCRLRRKIGNGMLSSKK